MTTSEARAVIEEWNELRRKVEALLLLGDEREARATADRAAKLPLTAARDLVYDEANGTPDLIESGLFGQSDGCRRILPHQNLEQLDSE